jgi:hypothetical protein
MTSRLKPLIASAACAALFAIAFANVALAQQGCFTYCNRAPEKPVAMSLDLTSSGQTGAMKKPTIRRHTKKVDAERERHIVKP